MTTKREKEQDFLLRRMYRTALDKFVDHASTCSDQEVMDIILIGRYLKVQVTIPPSAQRRLNTVAEDVAALRKHAATALRGIHTDLIDQQIVKDGTGKRDRFLDSLI